MKQGTRRLILALMVPAIIVGAYFLSRHSRQRAALENYKAALRARGEKLTYSELAMIPSTDPRQLAARLALTNNTFTPLDPLLIFEFAAPGAVRVAWRQEALASANKAITNWDQLDHAVALAGPALANLRAALENPPPDGGWRWTDDADLNDANSRLRGTFVQDRYVAQALGNAAIAALHRGDLDKVLADLHALADLARVNSNEVNLVSQMIRIAIAGEGLDATWQALQAPGWDESKLSALQRDWEGLDFIATTERGYEGERANSQAVMLKVRHTNPNAFAKMTDTLIGIKSGSGSSQPTGVASLIQPVARWLSAVRYKSYGLDADEILQLQHETAVIDALRALETNQSWPVVNATLTNLHGALDARLSADRLGRYRMSALVIPNLERATKVAVENETLRRLTVTFIALKRYQLKYGRAPQDLTALKPEFLSAIPIDPMSGQALKYKLNANGAFILYSTGEDGHDDGGDPAPANATDAPGLWSGKDSVWPSAAP